METGRGGGSGYADYTWATKIVYIEAWFNTLWRLRTENLWNFTLEMSLGGALGFQWLPSRSNIIHINRWKLESDIIPSSAARKNVLVAFMKNEAEARAWYPQRWKVHPSMKIMRFWWGCLKWLQEFSPLTASFENKQLDVVISIIMLFTSQKKSQVCMHELLTVENFRVSRFWQSHGVVGASAGVHCVCSGSSFLLLIMLY